MAAQDRKASPEVWLLQLTDDGAPDVPSGYIYLPPPTDPAYILRFEIEGTSSVCRQGSLWVNIPASGEAFRRDQYRQHTYVTRHSQSKFQLILKGCTGFTQTSMGRSGLTFPSARLAPLPFTPPTLLSQTSLQAMFQSRNLLGPLPTTSTFRPGSPLVIPYCRWIRFQYSRLFPSSWANTLLTGRNT